MKIKGFTPIFDSLAQKYDPYTALVYGKIWRICDWSTTGICTMSNDKIAEQIGLSEKTIRRKKEILADDKLIRVVGKSGVTDTVVVCHEVVMDMELDYTSDSGGGRVDSQSLSTDGESDKDSNIEDTKNSNGAATAIKEGLRVYASIQGDFQEHLGLTPNWDTKSNQLHYLFFRERYDAGQTVKEFSDWWAGDWKGKDGSFPSSLNQVQTLWMQAFVKKENDLEAENRRLKELHG